MFGNFSYLIYNLLLGGLIALILVIAYKDLFKKHLAIIVKALILLVPISIFLDSNAVRTSTWFYPQDKRLGLVLLDSPIETSIFGIILVIIICMLTFIFLDLEEKKASFSTWLKTIVGISSLSILTTGVMLLLRFLTYN